MPGILDMQVALYSDVDAIAHCDPDWEGTLNEFWEANQDGMDWGEICQIARDLSNHGRHMGGGGAAAEYVLVKVGEEQLRQRIARLQAELAALKAPKRVTLKEIQERDLARIREENARRDAWLATPDGMAHTAEQKRLDDADRRWAIEHPETQGDGADA